MALKAQEKANIMHTRNAPPPIGGRKGRNGAVPDVTRTITGDILSLCVTDFAADFCSGDYLSMEENLWNRYSCIPNGNIHSESSVTPEISEVGDDCDLPVKVEPYNQFKADPLLPRLLFHPTDEELAEYYLPESNTVEDKEWFFFCEREKKYKNGIRPNRATGSRFWKATGVDKPIYSSTVNTRSVNNWRNDHKYLRCYPQSPTTSSSEFISTFNSMNKQQQLFELQKYLVSKHGNGHDCNSSSCETSTKSHHPHVPEFHIDILEGNDHLDVRRGANGHSDFIVYQAWNEYKNQLKNSKFDDDAIKIMSGIFAAVAGQVVAGVMVNRLSSSPSSSWAGPVVEVATVLGLSVTLVGTTLRGKSRALSTLVIKIGALTIASAIILSMGLHLPPAMAWTLGTVAFLIMAVAAALA